VEFKEKTYYKWYPVEGVVQPEDNDLVVWSQTGDLIGSCIYIEASIFDKSKGHEPLDFWMRVLPPQVNL
jgi:hypothetical protein